MTSREMRHDNLFIRNDFEPAGRWGLPLIKKQEIDLSNVHLIACSDTRSNDLKENTVNGVHFFVDDYRFSSIYNMPYRSLLRLAQYAFLLSPDFSVYGDMEPWRQLESVAKNRWCGAFWQSQGLTVIPSVSWSTPRSYEFCFDGIEPTSIVAVGMVGCKNYKLNFLRGYETMLERLNPQAIICFGAPFREMRGNLIPVDYRSSRKVVR